MMVFILFQTILVPHLLSCSSLFTSVMGGAVSFTPMSLGDTLLHLYSSTLPWTFSDSTALHRRQPGTHVWGSATKVPPHRTTPDQETGACGQMVSSPSPSPLVPSSAQTTGTLKSLVRMVTVSRTCCMAFPISLPQSPTSVSCNRSLKWSPDTPARVSELAHAFWLINWALWTHWV